MPRVFLFFLIFVPFYAAAFEPIDVVIPCTDKDIETLPYCIEAALKNVQNIRRVIIVSSTNLTDRAEWFDEALFPFSKEDVRKALDRKKKKVGSRLGWYYQQLLKFYAPRVIPGISSNVLILDADTIFLRPVSFLSDEGGSLFCYDKKKFLFYHEHMQKLVGIKRVYPSYSGIVHHMLFQRNVIDALFNTIENKHRVPVWKAFCRCVDPKSLSYSGASEYEIYFNFALTYFPQCQLRPLKFRDVDSLENQDTWIEEGYDFISCHSYLR